MWYRCEVDLTCLWMGNLKLYKSSRKNETTCSTYSLYKQWFWQHQHLGVAFYTDHMIIICMRMVTTPFSLWRKDCVCVLIGLPLLCTLVQHEFLIVGILNLHLGLCFNWLVYLLEVNLFEWEECVLFSMSVLSNHDILFDVEASSQTWKREECKTHSLSMWILTQ